MILQAADIRKSYGDLQILKGVQLSVNRGEIVSIVGRSGAGKSTLLHILGLLDKADSGALRIGDTDVAALDKRRQSAFRNQRIGFIFQFHHLLPEFTALENAAMPALIAGESKREAFRRASELLDYLDLANAWTTNPANSAAANNNARPWPAPWSTARIWCLPTSLRAISTALPPRICTDSSAA